MTLNEYQDLAMRTSRTDLTAKQHTLNGLLGLAGETGECCDLMKKHEYQDGRDIWDDLVDELGDVMWYVAEVASSIGYDLDTIAANNVEKLKKRYPEGFSAERSLHREE